MDNTLKIKIKTKGYTLVELLLAIGIASSMAVMVFLFGARLYESSKVAAAREIAIRVAGGVEGRYAASLSFAGIGSASPSYVQGIVLQGGAIAAPWGPATLSASTISTSNDAWTLTFSGVSKSACAELLAQVSPNFGASGANSGWSAAASGKGVDPAEANALCSGSPNTVSFRSKARSGSGAPVAVAAALACPSGQAAVAGACVPPPSPACVLPWALNAAGTACELSCPAPDKAVDQGGTGCSTLCVYPQALSSDGIHCQGGPSTPLSCALPRVANAAGTACVISCPSPTVANAAGSACVIPLACSAPFVANAAGTACVCAPPKVPSADGLSCVASGTDCPSASSLQSWTGSDASSCKGTPVAVGGSGGSTRSASSAAGVSGATGSGALAQTCTPIGGAPGTFQWVNGSSTCAMPPLSCPLAPNPNPVVTDLGCPSGYSGSNTSIVAKTCGAGTGYAWVAGSPVLSNTCLAPAPIACVPKTLTTTVPGKWTVSASCVDGSPSTVIINVGVAAAEQIHVMGLNSTYSVMPIQLTLGQPATITTPSMAVTYVGGQWIHAVLTYDGARTVVIKADGPDSFGMTISTEGSGGGGWLWWGTAACSDPSLPSSCVNGSRQEWGNAELSNFVPGTLRYGDVEQQPPQEPPAVQWRGWLDEYGVQETITFN